MSETKPRATLIDQILIGAAYHGSLRELHGWTVRHVAYCTCHACFDDDLDFLAVTLGNHDQRAEILHPSAESFTQPRETTKLRTERANLQAEDGHPHEPPPRAWDDIRWGSPRPDATQG